MFSVQVLLHLTLIAKKQFDFRRRCFSWYFKHRLSVCLRTIIYWSVKSILQQKISSSAPFFQVWVCCPNRKENSTGWKLKSVILLLETRKNSTRNDNYIKCIHQLYIIHFTAATKQNKQKIILPLPARIKIMRFTSSSCRQCENIICILNKCKWWRVKVIWEKNVYFCSNDGLLGDHPNTLWLPIVKPNFVLCSLL